jgi:eukaryotic-like serine/threonine-protein kinase
LTELGLVIGTAGYMSPEQVRGWNADARSDVFAFGAVLYEMLTGVRAFTGDSVVETMNAILTTSPSAMSRVPAPFVPIVQQCLEKDADRRYGSMRDVQAALESVQLDLCEVACASGVDAGPERAAVSIVASWFAVRWRGAAVAVIAGAVVVAAIFINRGDDPPGLGASGRPAIAVMPLDDRSGDPALAWLSEGVSSMLVTALAQTPGLDVIGTERLQAGFRELGREPSDRSARFEVARHGGAGAVLLGSFRKAGSDIRIEVQVQAVDTGRVVVARSEQGTDPFAIVDTIARDVRTALDVANRPGGRPLRDVTTTSLESLP